MIRIKSKVVWLLSVVVCFITAGCGTNRTVVHRLGNGYQVTTTYRGLVHVGVQIELQYRHPNGKLELINGGLYNDVINHDTIVFLGASTEEPERHNEYLFAYQPPGPVIDITRQMYALEAQRRDDTVPEPHALALVATLQKTADGVVIGVAYEKWGNPQIKLSWAEISDMMHEAKADGVLHTNWIGGVPFMKKEIDAK